MNYKSTILGIFFTILLSNLVFATPPEKPICYEVKNPEYYKNIVYSTEVYSYFSDWELKDIKVGCRYEINQINSTSVSLHYSAPKSYSTNNLNYQMWVDFLFENDQLTNLEELNQLHIDYKKVIENFESEELIRFFIKTTSAVNVTIASELRSTEPKYFTIESSQHEYYEYIGYNFIDKSVESISFFNQILIESAERFIPGIYDPPQIKEFKNNMEINFIKFDKYSSTVSINTLTLFLLEDNAICELCEPYLIYNLNQPSATGYSLDNSFEWKTFPEIQKSHNIIKEKLLIGEFSNCTIDKGDEDSKSYTTLYFDQHRVNLICGEGYELRNEEAVVPLNQDGFYTEPYIYSNLFKEYTQKRELKPKISLVLSLIIVLIVILIIKLKKNYNTQTK